MHISAKQIFTTLAQRQVADGSCTICALQDIAAMQRLGPEAFLKFAQRTRFEEGNGGSLETMVCTNEVIDSCTNPVMHRHSPTYTSSIPFRASSTCTPSPFPYSVPSRPSMRRWLKTNRISAPASKVDMVDAYPSYIFNLPLLTYSYKAAELHPEIVKIMAADSEASSITQANVANLFDAAQSIVARKSDPTAQTEALEELATSLTTLGGELPLDVAEKQSVLDGVNRLGAVTRMQLYTEILMA